MKILWVNNVASICGGTFACTLSMVKALPDCKHTVVSFSGSFCSDTKAAFGPDVELKNIGPMGVREFALGKNFDIIVYQNTSDDRMPHVSPDGALPIHYLHSGYSQAINANKRAPVRFCVSRWLAEQTKLDGAEVLHQPVTIPPLPPLVEPLRQVFTVGRICTPTPNKWERDRVYKHIANVTAATKEVIDWELVGCPPNLWAEISKMDEVSARLYQPSFHARSRMHNWHAMLYDSKIVETFGRTVREAQRCGVVPIVRKQGGFIEQIKQGESGYLCETEDDYIKAVTDMLGNHGHWTKLSNISKTWGNAYGGLEQWREKFLRRLSHCLI